MSMKHILVFCIICLGLNGILGCADKDDPDMRKTLNAFYIDSEDGDDTNDGISETTAWKSLTRVDGLDLLPGDTIKFRRGSSFEGTLYINDSGEENRYIVLTSYGDTNDRAPSFTNTGFDPDTGKFGNCIRLTGDYIIVENLYFEHTVAELTGKLGFPVMWELGAIYIDKTASHCIIRNNEIFDCGVGIKSYGEHALITNNYIHD